MRVEAEFTSEPFRGEGDPPLHALRARDAALAAGLETVFGPLGTTVRGEQEVVVRALADVMTAVLDSGGTRITLRLDVEEQPADQPAE